MTEPGAPRRFPVPWRVVEHPESHMIEDANGVPIAFVYFEDDSDRRKIMNRLTSDEAWRIASNIAKLPDLLVKR